MKIKSTVMYFCCSVIRTKALFALADETEKTNLLLTALVLASFNLLCIHA